MIVENFEFWSRKTSRLTVAILLTLTLSACGGGSSGGEPDNNDQAGTPNINDPVVQNTPPTLNAPTAITLPNTGAALFLQVNVSDAENDPVSLSWSVDSSPPNGNLQIDPLNASNQVNISATVEGNYVIAVTANDGTNTSRTTIQVEVSNQPPPILGLSLYPAAPVADDYISMIFDNWVHVFDYYSEINYVWRINGNVIDNNFDSLWNANLTRGDRISLEVIASVEGTEVRATSPEVVIANSPPRLDYIHITPLEAGARDNLNANLSHIHDIDGDSVTVTYQWFLNDAPLMGQTGDELLAGFGKADDRIKVTATLSDGSDSAEFTSQEIQLINLPSYLEVNPSPIILTHGSAASFSARFVDPDGESVQTELAEGPNGLTYDAGTQTAYWTPTPTMFANEETFFAYFNSSDGQREELQITVRNEQSSSVLARSGIPIPRSDFELDIGDFDGDGRAELLSTDSQEHIFTLEFDSLSITQDWLYPFAVKPGESILRLWAYGADLSQILVVTSNGVSLIESRTKLPRRLIDTSYLIAAAAYEDFDQDGDKELLLIDPEGTMNKLNPEDVSLSAFGESVGPVEWPQDHYTVAVGNVDQDPALEIVVSSGKVVDGANGSIEWSHHSRFGNNITIGDVDGDGDIDIVAADRWENVTSYDPIAKTSIWSYNINDFCSLTMENIDADPQDELIAGPCQHGSLEIYDGASGSMVLQEQIASEYYNSGMQSFSLGDLDNDGVTELVFSTGSGSTAPDNMAVASFATLGDPTPGVVVNINPSQITGFKSIGWDTTTNGQQRAVFALPDTEGGDWTAENGADGHRLGILSTNGLFTMSGIIASNWGNLATGVVVDSNSDGISEAVVGVGAVYDGEVRHINLDHFTQTHTHTDLGGTEEYFRPEIKSMSLGIDSDGRSKAIITTNESKFQIYDIANRTADWTSGGLTGGEMLGAIAIQKASGFDIAAATLNELTLWSRSDDGSYAKVTTAAVECHFIQHVTNGSEQQIACVTSNYWESNSTISLFNLDLVKQSELNLDYTVTSISSRQGGDLLLGTKEEIESYSFIHEHTLRRINAETGSDIWKSAPLLGEINAITFTDAQNGVNQKMAVSTSSAMYITD